MKEVQMVKKNNRNIFQKTKTNKYSGGKSEGCEEWSDEI